MSYRIYRTRTDHIDTEHGEIELPYADTSECADHQHFATILPDGRLLVSYLACDDRWMDEGDAFGGEVPYVEHNDVYRTLATCQECWSTEGACDIGDDCCGFLPSEERKLYDLDRLMPVFVFTNGGQSGMDFLHDPDEWEGASGWLVLADDFTQPVDHAAAMVIFNAARDEWNSWANGDIWGVVHATYMPVTNDDPDIDGLDWQIIEQDVEACCARRSAAMTFDQINNSHPDSDELLDLLDRFDLPWELLHDEDGEADS